MIILLFLIYLIFSIARNFTVRMAKAVKGQMTRRSQGVLTSGMWGHSVGRPKRVLYPSPTHTSMSLYCLCELKETFRGSLFLYLNLKIRYYILTIYYIIYYCRAKENMLKYTRTKLQNFIFKQA